MRVTGSLMNLISDIPDWDQDDKITQKEWFHIFGNIEDSDSEGI